jgi:hypothetical protein
MGRVATVPDRSSVAWGEIIRFGNLEFIADRLDNLFLDEKLTASLSTPHGMSLTFKV